MMKSVMANAAGSMVGVMGVSGRAALTAPRLEVAVWSELEASSVGWLVGGDACR